MTQRGLCCPPSLPYLHVHVVVRTGQYLRVDAQAPTNDVTNDVYDGAPSSLSRVPHCPPNPYQPAGPWLGVNLMGFESAAARSSRRSHPSPATYGT